MVNERPSGSFRKLAGGRAELTDGRQVRRRSSSSSEAALVKVTINSHEVSVPEHSTVLDAARKAGVYVPTLCNHPGLPAKATCRLCLVEVEGSSKQVPACVTDVKEGMRVRTDSEAVMHNVVGNLSLLRANHPNLCMTCEASGRCEFQDLLYKYNVEDKLPKLREFTHEWDDATAAVQRNADLCIKCGRCVSACGAVQGMNIIGFTQRGNDEVVSTPFDVPLADTACISCGACIAACPTGALTERDEEHEVRHLLDSRRYTMIATTAPSVRVAFGEELGYAPGAVKTGKMVAALRHLGFDYVFDTNFAADVCIMEEGSELIERVTNGGTLPMFTSCCPGWINLVEKSYPELIPNLSSCKSPQGMQASLIKSYAAQNLGLDPAEIKIVSVMPCTAKKDEADRPQLMDEQGAPETDFVITTRELGRLMRRARVPLASLGDSEFDSLMGPSTGAATIFGTTGGVMEAALRTAYELVSGQPMPKIVYDPVRGLEGVKKATVPIPTKDGGELSVKVGVVHGTARVRHFLEKLASGEEGGFHFIEIMACPGGCIGGGGQPKSMDPLVLQKRQQGLYTDDERQQVRKSHENPMVQKLYAEFLEKPLGHRSHELLHTHYTDRSAGCVDALLSKGGEVHEHAVGYSHRHWSPQEVSKLREAVRVYGHKWQDVARLVGTRTPEACRGKVRAMEEAQ